MRPARRISFSVDCRARWRPGLRAAPRSTSRVSEPGRTRPRRARGAGRARASRGPPPRGWLPRPGARARRRWRAGGSGGRARAGERVEDLLADREGRNEEDLLVHGVRRAEVRQLREEPVAFDSGCHAGSLNGPRPVIMPPNGRHLPRAADAPRDRRVPRGDQRARRVARQGPEGREGLLPRRPRDAVVGGHGLDRRDGDFRADVPLGARRRVSLRLHVPPARVRVPRRPHRRLGDPPPGLLPGRDHDGLRAPRAALRRRGAPVHVAHLHGHARHGGERPARRPRHPDRAHTRRAGLGRDPHAGGRDGALHVRRRHQGGDLDRPDPGVRLPVGRGDVVRDSVRGFREDSGDFGRFSEGAMRREIRSAS